MTVSNDLRAVERDVDNAYRASPLLSLPRSEAMWYFLAECEELYMRNPSPVSVYVTFILRVARISSEN